jgi:queuine tRNA-ribosyltransferase
MGLSFEVVARSGRARAGVLETPHGRVETPVFMPVGTAGAVKAVLQRDLAELGATLLLANTYHLMLRPGGRIIQDLGGLHGFTGWTGPFLTDSGGYQVFSLAALRRIDDDGVLFQSHLDGSAQRLSPERSMEIQMQLGADIVMALDECPPSTASRPEIAAAAERTTRWAERSRRAHTRTDQWLFGIVQGGVVPEARVRSVRELVAMDFPGYAIGGLAVGEEKPEREGVLDVVEPLLPPSRPRYLMGVGTPEDILEAVARGIDMFDCVLPTRNGRNGQAFTPDGPVTLKQARWARDPAPLQPDCPCLACRRFSRAYLRHLFMSEELLVYRLLSLHNLYFFLGLMGTMRAAIAEGRFAAFRAEFDARYAAATP